MDVAPKGAAEFQRLIGVVGSVGRREVCIPMIGRTGRGIGRSLAILLFIAPVGKLSIEIEIVGGVSCRFSGAHPLPTPLGATITQLRCPIMVGRLFGAGLRVKHHRAGEVAVVGSSGKIGRKLCGG